MFIPVSEGKNMDEVQIPIEGNEVASWRQICNERIERLKAIEFPSSEDPPSHPRLLQEEPFGEKNSVIYELQKFVQSGNVDRFVDALEKVCLEKKLHLSAIFDQVSRAGDSLLHEAANLGSENIATLIGHHFPGLLTKTNIKGDTPLHAAARSKSSGVIKIILSEYDAHAHKSKSSTENKDVEITRLTNKEGNTALHEGVYNMDVDGVTMLFDADKCVAHYSNKSGQSPLCLAIRNSDQKIIDIMLEAPFPDDKPLPKCRENSPLHAAIYTFNADLMKEILERKPDLMYLRDEDGGTPLHFAASRGYVEGVRMLLNKSALIALEWNAKGHLPIHLACKWGHLKVVEELLKQEWAHDSRVLVNKKGQNILHVAAKNGRDNVVNYILRNTKLNVNEKDEDGNTPLHLASRSSVPNILLSLTRDKRIHVNVKNNEGFTAIDIVAMQWRSETLETNAPALSYMVLYSVGAQRSHKALSIIRKRSVSPNLKSIKDMVNTVMVVAILIATVTFAAGFTVPGGLYSSDNPNKGMAVLGNSSMFKIFVIFNSVAMYCSTLGSFLLLWAQFGDYYLAIRFFSVAFRMVGVALVTMCLAFMAAVRLVVTKESWLASLITIIGIGFFFFILSLYILAVFPIGYYGSPVLRQVNNFFIRISISLRGIFPKVKAKKLENFAFSQHDMDIEKKD